MASRCKPVVAAGVLWRGAGADRLALDAGAVIVETGQVPRLIIMLPARDSVFSQEDSELGVSVGVICDRVDAQAASLGVESTACEFGYPCGHW